MGTCTDKLRPWLEPLSASSSSLNNCIMCAIPGVPRTHARCCELQLFWICVNCSSGSSDPHRLVWEPPREMVHALQDRATCLSLVPVKLSRLNTERTSREHHKDIAEFERLLRLSCVGSHCRLPHADKAVPTRRTQNTLFCLFLNCPLVITLCPCGASVPFVGKCLLGFSLR